MSKSGSRSGGTTEESIKVKRTRQLPLGERLLPYAVPWVLGFFTLPLGEFLAWQASSPVMTIVVTLCAALLTWITHTTWDRRHEHTRNVATVITAGFTGWLVACTASSPDNRPMLTTWVVMWVMLSLIWNIRHAGINTSNKHDQPSSKAESVWAPIRGLKKSRTKHVETTKDGAVRIVVQHPPGQTTTDDVRSQRKNVAGRLGVDESAVSVGGVFGRADQSLVTVRPDNPTGRVVRWTGPSAPGKSISDAPVRLGVRADSKPLAFWLTGDDDTSRPAPHTLWTGMTGSGKTEAFCTAVLEMRSRIDCVPVVADPVKFMLSFGDIADAFAIAADGPDQTAQLIRNLPETLRYRAWLLGKLGYKQWVPECYTKHGIPVVPVHIEEAAQALASNDDFKMSIQTARALGMPLSASMQVAVFRSMPREARAQFGNSIAFGVREMQDARFALTDGTLAAGADPTKWANNHPGRCYAELVGTPEEQWAEECRVFKVTLAEKRATLEATRPHWAQIDPGTAMRLSAGIDRPDASVLAGIGTSGDYADPVPFDEEEDTEPVRLGKTIIDLSTEGKPSKDDAREMIGAKIDELEMRGARTISITDFNDVIPLLGRHRTWVYFELDRQAASGRLERVEGDRREYVIRPRGGNGVHLPTGV
jgi:hypothetical protein